MATEGRNIFVTAIFAVHKRLKMLP